MSIYPAVILTLVQDCVDCIHAVPNPILGEWSVDSTNRSNIEIPMIAWARTRIIIAGMNGLPFTGRITMWYRLTY
jgi:hypothetical protein